MFKTMFKNYDRNRVENHDRSRVQNLFQKRVRNHVGKIKNVVNKAGKTAAKDIRMKAIDVGKTVAIDAGKKLVEKAAKRLSTPKSQVANVMVPPEEITKKVN